MGIETVSLIIAAFVSGSLGIAALMRNFHSRLCIWFAAFCGTLFAHDAMTILESFDSVSQYGSPRLHILTTLVLGPVALFCLRELVPMYGRRLQKLIWIYLGGVAFCLVLMAIEKDSRVTSMLLTLSHIFFLFPTAVWMITLSKAERQTELTRERLRLRYALWFGAITIVFFLTDLLHVFGIHIPPLGTLARVVFLMFMFQTFIQKELMTSEEVVAKISLFGGLALILSTIYAMLVSWVGDQPDLFFFNTLIASFVILVLFDPIRNLTLKFTRKLFLRRNAMVEDELNALSVELMGIVEPAELSRRIALSLRRCLGMGSSSLYLLESDGLSYVRVSFEQSQSDYAELSASDPIFEYMMMRRGRPFVLETIESDRDSFYAAQPRKFCQACIETMRRLGADFVIPFLHESKLVGFSASQTGERIILSNEQLRLFIPVSRQIALLIKNSQVFTFLRNRDKLAAVGEMAAGLAHEIKNPLGAIKGAAELLKEEVHRANSNPEFLDIILAETDRLSIVLTDFLDYAKPRRYYPQPSCDPVRVIEHTAALILRDAKVNFEIETEKQGQGLLIEADPEILKQVLLNLFINAIQAMEDVTEKASLCVRVREVRPRNLLAFAESLPLYKVWEGWEALKVPNKPPYIQIDVEDNGPGVRPEDLPRIFVPFFTTKPKGTGLGLAICQRLIESMGGSISVRSNAPKSGLTFVIQLPIRREENVPENSSGNTGANRTKQKDLSL
jgi:two-component system, NtrC family, sensor histidine kinase HydH